MMRGFPSRWSELEVWAQECAGPVCKRVLAEMEQQQALGSGGTRLSRDQCRDILAAAKMSFAPPRNASSILYSYRAQVRPSDSTKRKRILEASQRRAQTQAKKLKKAVRPVALGPAAVAGALASPRITVAAPGQDRGRGCAWGVGAE